MVTPESEASRWREMLLSRPTPVEGDGRRGRAPASSSRSMPLTKSSCNQVWWRCRARAVVSLQALECARTSCPFYPGAQSTESRATYLPSHRARILQSVFVGCRPYPAEYSARRHHRPAEAPWRWDFSLGTLLSSTYFPQTTATRVVVAVAAIASAAAWPTTWTVVGDKEQARSFFRRGDGGGGEAEGGMDNVDARVTRGFLAADPVSNS